MKILDTIKKKIYKNKKKGKYNQDRIGHKEFDIDFLKLQAQRFSGWVNIKR